MSKPPMVTYWGCSVSVSPRNEQTRSRRQRTPNTHKWKPSVRRWWTSSRVMSALVTWKMPSTSCKYSKGPYFLARVTVRCIMALYGCTLSQGSMLSNILKFYHYCFNFTVQHTPVFLALIALASILSCRQNPRCFWPWHWEGVSVHLPPSRCFHQEGQGAQETQIW